MMDKQFDIFNFGKKQVSKIHFIDPEGNIISFPLKKNSFFILRA